MNPTRPRKPTHLNDDALLARLVELNAAHRLSLTSLLEHIAEVDVRRLFARRGHSSMHRYCVRELNMSDDEAFARIRVARLGRRLPSVLAYLADGRVSLTAARLLTPHLTRENHRAVLAEASGSSVAEIKQLVARLAPKPDVPTRVRALSAPRADPRSGPSGAGPHSPSVPAPASPPARSPVEPEAVSPTGTQMRSSGASAATKSTSAPPLTLEPPRPVVAPLAPERFEVRFTASAALIEKLTEVTALLSHAVPDGDLPTVLERALDLARTQLIKRRFGAGAIADRADASSDDTSQTAPPPVDVGDEGGSDEASASGSGAEGQHDAEARPLTSRPVLEDRALASRAEPQGQHDAEARPLTSRPVLEDRALASRAEPQAQRDAEARPLASTPAPRGGALASCAEHQAQRDAEARPLASTPAPRGGALASCAEHQAKHDAEARPLASTPAPRGGALASCAEHQAKHDAEARPLASTAAPEGAASAADRSPSSTSRAMDRLVSEPAPTREPSVGRSRYIPAAVRAEVWRRDGGRCSYADPDSGHVCGERRFLELHHEHAFARGGAHSPDVLTLRCRAHNLWAARLDFGADHIDACIARR